MGLTVWRNDGLRGQEAVCSFTLFLYFAQEMNHDKDKSE